MWREECDRIQANEWDDRRLYWRRLAAKKQLRNMLVDHLDSEQILSAFEHASRGIKGLTFSDQADIRVVVTGFDPFGLHEHIDQSNPSGLMALLLAGSQIPVGEQVAEVQTAILPVRFDDFDAGIIERIFEPLLSGHQVDLLLTVSMGRDGFDLERFPGRRRSSEMPDNLDRYSGGSADNPVIPRLYKDDLSGPEFVEFSLPVAAMISVGGEFPINDNRLVCTIEQGEAMVNHLEELDHTTSVRGSGGGYLSNEISYRTLRLVRQLANQPLVTHIRAGHIHTPRIIGFEPDKVRRITGQLQQMILASIEAMGG